MQDNSNNKIFHASHIFFKNGSQIYNCYFKIFYGFLLVWKADDPDAYPSWYSADTVSWIEDVNREPHTSKMTSVLELNS